MTQPDEQIQQTVALGEQLTNITEASLHISKGLDLDEFLQSVLDCARTLTGASYAAITTLEDGREMEDVVISGLSAEETQCLWKVPDGRRFFTYLAAFPGPRRVADMRSHARAAGFALEGFSLPVGSFLAVPMHDWGVNIGNIHVAKEEFGEEFSQEDEENLVLFASQVAPVVANARTRHDEKRARTRLETLIDTSPVGVVDFDVRRGTPMSFNREARRIAESLLEPDQMLQQLLDTITVTRSDGSNISLLEFPIAEVLCTNETVRAEEIVLSAPNGRSIAVLLNATPICFKANEVESVIVTVQDLTPLEETARVRAEFLAMVSHELRTPLTSIKGAVVTMLEDMEDLDRAEMRQFLHIIRDQADSMRDLIGNLLDVSHIETGTLPVDIEPIEVAALVDRSRNTFLRAGGRDDLDIDLEPGMPRLMADPRRIVQVIVNLLNNAARHSPESSTIRIAAVRNGVHVEISVTDEGRGIPSEHIPNLFRKIYHEDDDPWRETGLGLAICKGIVEAHGGRIWAESDGPGLGARFAFTVPAAEAQQFHAAPSPLQGSIVGEPILVVDDDPQALRLIRKALAGAGYAPIVTADPKETISLVEEHRPHLVLLDLMLPGTDGIGLMRDILSFADVPVIFISAYGRDRVVAQAFDSGAADYIVKPFSPTELAARVRAALRKGIGPDHSAPSESFVLGDLTVDYAERRVILAGRPLRLTAKEYQLLYALSVNAGRVVTYDKLLRGIWGAKRPNDLRALRTHMGELRRKLGDNANNPTYFTVEPRVGYRMARPSISAPTDDTNR